MKRICAILVLSALAGCASYGGSGLVVGESSQEDVVRVMGEPAMRWTNPDGSRQLAYPRGPAGVHMYMARVDARGKLASVDNTMTPAMFARIQAGMSADDVLRLLGPSVPSWTNYFKARDELVWQWRYCDDFNQLARFDVLFDGTAKNVRSTMTQAEDHITNCGRISCWCGH
jgi:hypothetical protein